MIKKNLINTIESNIVHEIIQLHDDINEINNNIKQMLKNQNLQSKLLIANGYA